MKAIFQLILQTCLPLKKCNDVNAGGSNMRRIFNDIVPSNNDQIYALSSIIAEMDVQLKTFVGDLRPLNLPSLLVHLSHCKMITSVISTNRIASELARSGIK
eukprot:scaffold3198_cov213-Alexandrium_tamarense.AAC.26